VSGVPRPVTRVARGATYMFFQGIASSFIGVVYIFLLIRFLPPPNEGPEMGIYALLTFIHSLVGVFGSLSLPSASARYISRYIGEGNVEKAKGVVTRVLQVSLLISVILSISLFFSANWISMTLLGDPTWTLLFQIFAFLSFFTVLRFQVLGFLQGLQKIRELATLNLMYDIVEKSLAIFLLYMGMGLISVVYGWLAGFGATSLAGLILTARFLGIFGKPHPSKPLINFSYPLYVSQIVGFFAGWIDQLLILPFMGVAILGLYNVANRAAIVPSIISVSIVTALFPQLSELHARKGKDTLRQAFHVSTRVVLVSFPAILGLAALAYPIIVLFAGIDYAAAVLPLTIICFASLFGEVGLAIGPTLMTIERTKIVLKLTIASIITNTVVSYVTLAHLNLGTTGPALARVFTSIVSLGLGVYALKRYLEITFDKDALWKALAASIIMAIAVVFLQKLIFNLYLLPLYVAVGAVVYFLSLVALKAIKKSDVERVRDYLPSRLEWAASWLDRVAVAG